MEYVDIAEYESLMVKSKVHRTRGFINQLQLHSQPDQTIMLSQRGGYFTFRLVESGQEIPIPNVASAIPKRAPAATRTQKTTKNGLTPKLAASRRRASKPKPAEVEDADEE